MQMKNDIKKEKKERNSNEWMLKMMFAILIVFPSALLLTISLKFSCSTALTNVSHAGTGSTSTIGPYIINETTVIGSGCTPEDVISPYSTICDGWIERFKMDVDNNNTLSTCATLQRCKQLCEADLNCLLHGFVYDEVSRTCYSNNYCPEPLIYNVTGKTFHFCVKKDCDSAKCDGLQCIEKDIQYDCDCRATPECVRNSQDSCFQVGIDCANYFSMISNLIITSSTDLTYTFFSSYNECLRFYQDINTLPNKKFEGYSDKDYYCIYSSNNGVSKTYYYIRLYFHIK